MKWMLFTGSSLTQSTEVRADVKREAEAVLLSGAGIVSGGAVGVDYYASAVALSMYPDGSRLKVVVPMELSAYIEAYREKIKKDALLKIRELEEMIALLMILREVAPEHILAYKGMELTGDTFKAHDREEVTLADGVYAFEVEGSLGTAYTVRIAKERGIPVLLHKLYKQ